MSFWDGTSKRASIQSSNTITYCCIKKKLITLCVFVYLVAGVKTSVANEGDEMRRNINFSRYRVLRILSVSIVREILERSCRERLCIRFGACQQNNVFIILIKHWEESRPSSRISGSLSSRHIPIDCVYIERIHRTYRSTYTSICKQTRDNRCL